MLPTQRRQAILAEVRQARAVSAEDLARRYGVSLETIRRDLRGLRDRGLLERVYGGALSVRSTEGDFATRSTLHAARKQAIAELAATLVEPEDTLVIDIGTTALEVARALPESFRGRVLTNSVPAAMALADREEIQLLLCGGQVRHGDAACFGAQAEAFFADFYADKAFLGSGGVHAQAGLTDYHPPEVTTRRTIIAHAAASYVLADSSKLGAIALHRVCPLSRVTAVLTDHQASAEATDALVSAGCTVLWPSLGPPALAVKEVMDMDQVTTGAAPEDEDLERFGYRQQFVRSLRHFESFAVAFSFISITTGIFTTYGFALATGGTRSIWTWPIVIVGQALVALVYGALSIRVPLSGYSYQWASRLANVNVGWWFGWMSFAFLTIVTVSVDYGLVQVAFQPLIGETYTPTSAALETLVVLALQAALIIASTRITTRVNNTAVATEIIGIVGLTVLLLIVAAVRSLGHWSNLTSTGPVPQAGYYAWLGPFMLATLLGAYTIVGFESASNLAEETHEPHKVIPRAMLRAVLISGVVGFAFLVALAYTTNKAAYASTAPVASIVRDVLGGVVQKIFLVFVCVSIFACGLIIMVTNGRLIYSMARDRRLPGHQLLHHVPRATGGPPWATILAAVLGGAITLVLRTHTAALATLFTASTIMPALLYAGTVLLYIFTRRRGRQESQGTPLHPFGKFELPIVAGAVIWLAYELIILIGPAEFRDAQYYVLGALGLGLVFYVVQLVTEREAMRTEPGQEIDNG
jgi:DeoR/GlpR family transcriptional regulator of sugar metabolism/amino acid transporter